jgi:hypothetical protein
VTIFTFYNIFIVKINKNFNHEFQFEACLDYESRAFVSEDADDRIIIYANTQGMPCALTF